MERHFIVWQLAFFFAAGEFAEINGPNQLQNSSAVQSLK